MRSARAPSAPSRPPTARRSSSGERLSNMQPLPRRIDEHRLHDSRPHALALQRIGAENLLADVLETALIESEGDVLVEDGRPGDRGDVRASVAGKRIATRE